MTSVMLVDGHPTMRFGLTQLLNSAGIRVAAGSMSGEQAIRLAEELRPDLVILGIPVPADSTGEADEVEMCRRLKLLPSGPRVLVHSADESGGDMPSYLLARADSYIPKCTECKELLEAVRQTVMGQRVWLLSDTAVEPARCAEDTSEGQRLTAREHEVLVLLLQRLSNAEIAEDLYITLQTTKNHVSKVLRKVGMKSRRELFR